jgi:hypothetical protein
MEKSQKNNFNGLYKDSKTKKNYILTKLKMPIKNNLKEERKSKHTRKIKQTQNKINQLSRNRMSKQVWTIIVKCWQNIN